MFDVKRILSKALHIFNGKALQAIIGLIQSVYIARVLDLNLLGVISIIIATYAVLNSFFSFKSAGPLLRYLVKFKEENNESLIKQLFSINLIIDFFSKVFVILIIFVIAKYIGLYILSSNEYDLMIILYSFIGLFTLLDSFWYTLLRDRERIKLLAYSPLVYSIGKFLILISIFTFLNASLENFIYAMLLSELIFFIYKYFILINILRYEYKISLLDILTSFQLNKLAKFSGYFYFMKHNYFASCISSLVKDADMLILGYFRSEDEVGLYRVAKTIASIFSNISSSLDTIIYYDFSKLIEKKSFDKLIYTIKKLTLISLSIVIVFISFAYLIGEDLLVFLYSEKFRESFEIFIVLFWGISASFLIFWSGQLILALNYPKLQTKVSLVNLIVFYILAFSLTPMYGAIGMAVSLSFIWFLGYFLLMINGLKLLKKFDKIEKE